MFSAFSLLEPAPMLWDAQATAQTSPREQESGFQTTGLVDLPADSNKQFAPPVGKPAYKWIYQPRLGQLIPHRTEANWPHMILANYKFIG